MLRSLVLRADPQEPSRFWTESRNPIARSMAARMSAAAGSGGAAGGAGASSAALRAEAAAIPKKSRGGRAVFMIRCARSPDCVSLRGGLGPVLEDLVAFRETSQ